MAKLTIELKGGATTTHEYDDTSIVKSDGDAVRMEIDLGNNVKSGTTFDPPRPIKVLVPAPPSMAYSLL